MVGRSAARGVAPWIQGTLVALAVSISFGAIVGTIYWWAQNALIAEIHAGLLRTSAIALRSIDVDLHQLFVESSGESGDERLTPEYSVAARPLREIILADPQVTYVWTVVLRDDEIYFVLDGTPPPEPGEEWPEDSVQVMEKYDNPPADLYTALREGRRMVSRPYSDEWGSFITAMEPVLDRDGGLVAVLGIDLAVTDFQKRLEPIRHGTIAAAAIGVLIAVLMGLGVWFNRKTDRNARELARQLRTVNALLTVSRALGSGVALDDLLPVIVRQKRAMMAAEHSLLYLLDERSGKLQLSTGAGEVRSAELDPRGIVGRVAATREPTNLAVARSDPDFDPSIDLPPYAVGTEVQALLAQPITDSRGRLLGVMQVLNKIGGGTFDEDDQILLDALGAQVVAALERAELTRVYVEKQKLDEALKLAASIQMSMLSRSFPPPGEGAVEIHACLLPAKEVGGDFYDFFWLAPRKLAFLVADVSGKGMPAALFMAKAKTLVKAHASLVDAPEEILARANDELSEDNDNGMFVTLFLGVLNTETGTVRFTNAGHNPPYVLPAAGGAAARLEAPEDMALGVMDGLSYTVHEINLTPGDALFLYTDGVNEAMNLRDEQYDYERLEEVLAQTYPSADVLDEAVLQSVRDFTFGAEPSDDLTILTVRWRGD